MVLGFDLQSAITLIATALLALITLLIRYEHVDFFWDPTLRLYEHVGVFVLAISLATLVVVDEVFSVGLAQLASRRRDRDSRDRIQTLEVRAREADKRARERDRTARASQLQARALLAGELVGIKPSPLHRRFLELITKELADMAGGSPA